MEDTQGGGAKKTTIEDFTMLRLLGKGSYGDVFLMEKKDGSGIFALKTMNKMHMAREKKQHHVFVEKEVLSSFESAWLVKLHNCFQDKQQLYFLMEHVRNGELAQYLQSRSKLALAESRFLGAEIVLILEFLRQCGIVHRDLKPENLLLDDKNHLKVIDFGTGKFIQLANNSDFIKKINAIKAKFSEPKQEEEGQQERRNSFVGTPFYLSPELIKEEEVSFPADIWAFGIMMYRMVTGKFPYPDMSDYELFESIKNDKILFPDDIDADAKDLISKLFDNP